MSANSTPDNVALKITPALVQTLIKKQFRELAHLEVRPVKLSGHDNRTFLLGEKMLVRLPSAQGYAAQVQKEQKWLPLLSSHLSYKIPKPLAQGVPSKDFPWDWSIYEWISGDSANSLMFENNIYPQLALDCAKFLNELHKIDATDAPAPGLHNYFRGAHISVYASEARSIIANLGNLINADHATLLLEKAISSKWRQKALWIHGDFASGNILVKDNRLEAVIDFGCMGAGDPACDLVIAWTFFHGEARKIFRSVMNLDNDTWIRASGWALWKACLILEEQLDKTGESAMNQLRIINDIIEEVGF